MNNRELCRICGENTKFIFKARILGKYNVRYFHCPTCGYIQTEKPFWLNEAYSDAISAEDTGVIQRNIKLANITAWFILFFFKKKLDFLITQEDMGFLFD